MYNLYFVSIFNCFLLEKEFFPHLIKNPRKASTLYIRQEVSLSLSHTHIHVILYNNLFIYNNTKIVNSVVVQL